MATRITHAVMFCYSSTGLRRLLIRLCFPIAVVLLVILISASEAFSEQYELVSYGEGAAVEPRYRTLNGDTSWSNEFSALSVDGVIRWSVLRACPIKHEAILGVVDTNRHLNVQVWDGSSWSNLVELVDDFPSGDSRFFDIAYESQSGNAMVVYGVNGSKNPCYRIWDGNSWSVEDTIVLPGGGDHSQNWIWLVPDANSDEIVLVSQTDDRKLYASVWDGSSWGDALGEFDKTQTNEYFSFVADREGQSGDVLVAWAPDKGRRLEYIVWDGTSWGPKLKTADFPGGFDPMMVDMSSDPGGNRIMIGVGDVDGDLGAIVWYGSDMGSFQALASECRVTGKNKSWDLIFEGESGKCLLIYSEGILHDVRYRIYDGAWSGERIGPALSDAINVLRLERNEFNYDNKAFLLSLADNARIESYSWDGIGFAYPYELEFGATFNIYEPLASVYVEDCVPSVSVVSPDGGEVLAIWDTIEIRWAASNACGIDSMTIEFSADAGSTWSLISSGEPNDSVYSWAVPPTPSESCLVEVTAHGMAGPLGKDESDDFFTIADLIPPDISVVFPNGGEVVEVGDTIGIGWIATDYFGIDHLDIQFSHTGGYTWEAIFVGLENDSTEPWVIPNIPSMHCLIRITAYDTYMNLNEDESDTLFRIINPLAPQVTLTSPNGGEAWAAGDSHSVTWSVSDTTLVGWVNVYLSTNGGFTWQDLAVGVTGDSSIDWEVPYAISDLCLIKVEAYRDSVTFGLDESDDMFSIIDNTPPTVTVISPNGGESVAVGDTAFLSWSAQDPGGVDSVSIYLSTDNGAGWTPIALGIPNEPDLAWEVPPLVSDSCLLRIYAYDYYLNEGSDVSDSVFSIIDNKPPQVTVVYPNGGELLQAGDTCVIFWAASDNVGVTHVDIYYSIIAGFAWDTVSVGESNDGEYDWVVPSTLSEFCLVKVEAFDAAMNMSLDQSDSLFAIADLTPPDISVVFPNGGEVLEVGDTVDISWIATDYSGIDHINIEFSRYGGFGWETLYVDLEDDSTESWVVPNTPSNHCLIRAVAYDTYLNVSEDTSDTLFAIINPLAPQITLSSPNGGEVWAAGDSHSVTWSVSDTTLVGWVNVYLSTNGGFTWQDLAVGVTGDSSIDWEVPYAISDLCLIKVEAYRDSVTFGLDESDSAFSIVDIEPPSVAVIYPNGGESMAVGDTVFLSWSAQDPGGVDSVSIYLSTDNGAGWIPIELAVPNQPDMAWEVPPFVSDSCLLKIYAYDPYSNIGSDFSDSAFSIIDDSPPQVMVVSPNGGEVWGAGDTCVISWTASDDVGVTHVDIYYSTAGPMSWDTVSAGEANDGEYDWVIPNTLSEFCLVKIEAFDAAMNTSYDLSDSEFTIADLIPPDVSVVFPNGGEIFEVGDTIDIGWIAADYSGIDHVDIEFSHTGGYDWEILYLDLENDSTEPWVIPNIPSMHCLIRITAYDTYMNLNEDESDTLFRIINPLAPQVTLTSPNGGEAWAAGDSHSVTWSVSDTTLVGWVNVYLSTNGGFTWQDLAVGVTGDSSIDWEVPYAISDLCLIKVEAYRDSVTFGLDESDDMFSIIDNTPPTVTVISPNGGESVAVGDTAFLSWSAQDPGGVDSVSIYLSTDNGAGWTPIALGIPNEPDLAWEVPPLVSDSCLLRIYAYDYYSNEGSDVSDSVFSIIDNKPPQVTVAYPNGGELLQAGDTCVIFWTASDNVGVTHVDIYYSTTGAFSWDTVSVGESNDFQYEWVVPATPSEMCLVKIEAFDAGMNMSFDVSDSLFTIYDQTGVVEGFRRGAIPKEFQLLQNEPNPFRTSTVLKLLSPTDGSISLSIYDCAGRLVNRLGGEAEPGVAQLIWDGRNSSGHLVPAGVYVCHLRVKSSEGIFEDAKKMMVVR